MPAPDLNVLSPYNWVEALRQMYALPVAAAGAAATLLDDRQLPAAVRQTLEQFGPALMTRRTVSASLMMWNRLSAAHPKPAFGIKSVVVDGEELPVIEDVADEAPFCRLLNFSVAGRADVEMVYLVAPMAGHFATLLRETVRDLLPYYDVAITDWANARDVPLAHGGFDLDDYIDQLIAHLRQLQGNAHAVAVCQAGVPLAAAVALMEADPNLKAFKPRTMALMGSPIDTSSSPTQVNTLATENAIDYFVRNFIAVVPSGYPGAHRAVYPGYLQLTAFWAMNPIRHEKSISDGIRHFAQGDFDTAEKIDSFYGEFLSTMDLTAEFYLQTVEKIFRENQLANGTFVSRGRSADLGAISDTPTLAIEGQRDDITGIGQTRVLLERLAVPEKHKHYLLVPESGHYGLFSGVKFRSVVLPALRELHRSVDPATSGTRRGRKPA